MDVPRGRSRDTMPSLHLFLFNDVCVSFIVIHHPLTGRKSVVEPSSPSPLLHQFLGRTVVHQSVSNRPLGGACLCVVVPDILDEPIVYMAWNDAADGEKDVDEKVLANAEADGDGERGEEESEKDDESGETVMVLPRKVDLSILRSRNAIS